MSEKELNTNNLLTEKGFWLRVLGVSLFNVGAVIIFTRPPLVNWFYGTGGIGDTINGLTAPAFSLFGTYLIYKSFMLQMLINKQQIETQAQINKQQADYQEKSNKQQADNLKEEIRRTTAQAEFNTYFYNCSACNWTN